MLLIGYTECITYLLSLEILHSSFVIPVFEIVWLVYNNTFYFAKANTKDFKKSLLPQESEIKCFMASRKFCLSSQATSLAMFRSDNQITTMLKDTPSK